ncbi:MAG: nucleoside-diphosphate kinase [Thaumarchaeota archaeon RBG_16_49_8]|nr:MAG: nucleoside-diphosphate kinase [Thaumarchaeota archaeon RBG_16_49_8]
MVEQTLIVIKPDGVQRELIGVILSRFENRGFTIKKMKMLTFTTTQAENFYSPHKEKPFFPGLVKFITSGPVVAVVLEGRTGVDAVSVVRSMIGATKSYEAAAGTIRGDFSLGLEDNVIHASDSTENYKRESKIVF